MEPCFYTKSNLFVLLWLLRSSDAISIFSLGCCLGFYLSERPIFSSLLTVVIVFRVSSSEFIPGFFIYGLYFFYFWKNETETFDYVSGCFAWPMVFFMKKFVVRFWTWIASFFDGLGPFGVFKFIWWFLNYPGGAPNTLDLFCTKFYDETVEKLPYDSFWILLSFEAIFKFFLISMLGDCLNSGDRLLLSCCTLPSF